MYQVMREACDQCLMSPNKIVSNERRTQILRDTAQRDCPFYCHKAQIAGELVVCRGHHNAQPSQLGRIAERLQCVELYDLRQTK